MEKIHFNKKSLSPQEQIDLLKNRGVSFTDESKALHFLKYHNYYYISGYIYYFELKDEIRTHKLESNIDFNDIIKLVNFDHKLRDLFFVVIQTLEIALRIAIARTLALKHGPFCLENTEIPDNILSLLKSCKLIKPSDLGLKQWWLTNE